MREDEQLSLRTMAQKLTVIMPLACEMKTGTLLSLKPWFMVHCSVQVPSFQCIAGFRDTLPSFSVGTMVFLLLYGSYWYFEFREEKFKK